MMRNFTPFLSLIPTIGQDNMVNHRLSTPPLTLEASWPARFSKTDNQVHEKSGNTTTHEARQKCPRHMNGMGPGTSRVQGRKRVPRRRRKNNPCTSSGKHRRKAYCALSGCKRPQTRLSSFLVVGAVQHELAVNRKLVPVVASHGEKCSEKSRLLSWCFGCCRHLVSFVTTEISGQADLLTRDS